jgi:hypothetical protein
MGLLGCKTVAELKERAPEILLVNAASARKQGGIFDRGQVARVLQPCLAEPEGPPQRGKSMGGGP